MKPWNISNALEYLGYNSCAVASIIDLYSESYRKYHNVDHINAMLAKIDPTFKEIDLLLEAIIFHDVIYSDEPVAPGFNEAASISFYSLLKATDPRFEVSTAFKVVQAINATAHHDKDQIHLNELSQTVLDLDLSSFALPWEEFRKVDNCVQDEVLGYCSLEQYTVGKVKFLETLLRRNRLFYIHEHWEKPARDNIENLRTELLERK